MEDQNIKYNFESTILSVLKKLATQEKKGIFTSLELTGKYGYFDAFAPKGISNIQGPTIIEIKSYLEKISLNNFFILLNKIIDNIEKNLGDRIKNFILITPKVIDTSEKEKYKKIFNNNIPGITIYFWSLQDLENKTKNFPEIRFIFQKKTNQLVDSVVDSFTKKALIQKKNFGSYLSSSFQNKRLVLILGAGISVSYNLPSWGELVSDMTHTLLRDKISNKNYNNQQLVEILNESSNYSPLIIMRLLKDNIGDRRFGRLLHKTIYKNFFMDNQSNLIKAITALCPINDRIGLRAIITFNFDNILEMEMQKNQIEFCPIYKNDDITYSNKIPVYHIHGFLPYSDVKESHYDSIVLSEESYHKQFTNPYSWQNFTLLNFLREYTCLFIGISLTDPNMRRILEISRLNSPMSQHYIIKKDDWSKYIKNKEIAGLFRGFEETSLSNLALNTIWVKNYEEIPELLMRIIRIKNNNV